MRGLALISVAAICGGLRLTATVRPRIFPSAPSVAPRGTSSIIIIIIIIVILNTLQSPLHVDDDDV